ncbi:uncharacterized protein ASCRUDRAFT_79515 [Ascoidea rubescens DSM 1968]|uniref:Uncharacterized protein n=1 Tax=Ascoidea rubescens DSM 1968 TaxID=1344418 RepID=A0A1D2VMR3_9ASCO|nr:hypothetical protein ASCRUDRAFT_79515 [Ascoidea rubescens DSM 1968]ODV62889.1 hypothetical protein ASCRUDRAFT_79515 [Ascoidea rubescens DSM 1968]
MVYSTFTSDNADFININDAVQITHLLHNHDEPIQSKDTNPSIVEVDAVELYNNNLGRTRTSSFSSEINSPSEEVVDPFTNTENKVAEVDYFTSDELVWQPVVSSFADDFNSVGDVDYYQY